MGGVHEKLEVGGFPHAVGHVARHAMRAIDEQLVPSHPQDVKVGVKMYGVRGTGALEREFPEVVGVVTDDVAGGLGGGEWWW